jgi:hypothetical protein
MNERLNNHLIKTIVDIIIFLEFTHEDDVNPDSAIEAMENIACELQLGPVLS